MQSKRLLLRTVLLWFPLCLGHIIEYMKMRTALHSTWHKKKWTRTKTEEVLDNYWQACELFLTGKPMVVMSCWAGRTWPRSCETREADSVTPLTDTVNSTSPREPSPDIMVFKTWKESKDRWWGGGGVENRSQEEGGNCICSTLQETERRNEWLKKRVENISQQKLIYQCNYCMTAHVQVSFEGS